MWRFKTLAVGDPYERNNPILIFLINTNETLIL